jgi:hypothetical protein
MKTKRKRDERKCRTADKANLTEGLRPSLHEQFGSALTEQEVAERGNTLAILKILEQIVSGRIPQRPGEDYFVTTCRLIVHGLSGVQTTAATRRALDKALAEMKRGTPGAKRLADLVEMRGWRGKGTVTRSILLPLASRSEDQTHVNPRLSEEGQGWPKN